MSRRIKTKPAKLESVNKVLVTQLADGRAVVTVYAVRAEPLHYIANELLLSRRGKPKLN
jgi:hypothetical protein